MSNFGKSRKPRLTSLIYAFIGATIAVVVNILTLVAQDPQSINKLNAPNIITAVVVGSVLGWIYDLALSLKEALAESVNQLSIASKRINLQEKAIVMLLTHNRHIKALDVLLTDSLRNKFNQIPYSNANAYYSYLKLAIEQSDTFRGVGNKTLRYYKEENRGEYLKKVSEKKMAVKQRILIIDETDKEKMEEDLKNVEYLEYYWFNTGYDVETYWILSSDLKIHLFNWFGMPTDFALYDDELLITYDSVHQVVLFDVIGDDAREKTFFQELEKQKFHKQQHPFKKISFEDFQAFKTNPQHNLPASQL